jgi:hypothetical protein
VITAYAEALKYTYIIGVPLGGIAIIAAAFLIRNVDIRAKKGDGVPATSTQSSDTTAGGDFAASGASEKDAIVAADQKASVIAAGTLPGSKMEKGAEVDLEAQRA